MSGIALQGTSEFDINLPPGTGAAFGAYYDLLKARSENMNLTAISGTEDVTRLHFLDSLALAQCVPFKNTKVIDIGSGAGFPGVPLKINEPTIDLTLLDATGKRVAFLKELCALLNIDAVILHARAEDAAHLPELREKYDICVSRAVARLNILCELCLPFVKTGGFFIAMKSTSLDEELDAANGAIIALGAGQKGCTDYTIPGTDITHRAVLIQKLSDTPDLYPRRYAKIKKSPL